MKKTALIAIALVLFAYSPLLAQDHSHLAPALVITEILGATGAGAPVHGGSR